MPLRRVLLVEDEPLWQQGIALLLASMPEDFALVATADCYEEALRLFTEHRPDIVLLDWKIKGLQDGLKVGEALMSQHGMNPRHMVLVTGSDPQLIPPHPFGYVPKSQIAQHLLPTLKALG